MTDALYRYEDDDAPLVPELPRDRIPRTDGGQPLTPPSGTRRADRPVDTGYADESTRDTEEILPLVPDYSGRFAD